MVSVFSLWLPILLSAVFVFVVSSIIHMVLKYHNSDFAEAPKEAEVMDACVHLILLLECIICRGLKI